MHRIFLFAVCSIVTLFLCQGCITEDRYACPSYLTIDMSSMSKDVEEGYIWFFDPFGNMLHKDTIKRSMFSKPYSIEITREDYAKCYMWGNLGKNTLLQEEYSLNTHLSKLDGKPADSLYFYSCDLNTNMESSYLKLDAKKEFATMNIVCSGYCDTSAFNINVTLLCKNRGFFVDKTFIEEYISTKAQLGVLGLDYSLFYTRILRQADVRDIKMTLDISPKLGKIVENPKSVVATIPIGEFLMESGYDMLQDNLSDISVKLDIAACFLYIKGEDWKKEKKFYVEF